MAEKLKLPEIQEAREVINTNASSLYEALIAAAQNVKYATNALAGTDFDVSARMGNYTGKLVKIQEELWACLISQDKFLLNKLTEAELQMDELYKNLGLALEALNNAWSGSDALNWADETSHYIK